MSTVENSVEKLGIRILHVGINAAGAEDAERLAAEFRDKMGFVPKDAGLSIFTSGIIEIMKEDGPGEKGHFSEAVWRWKPAFFRPQFL